MALVSIIIPCYNYGWLLAETLDSVLAQTYTVWECIVIDDGSTDDTLQVAMQYASLDERFKFMHQANGGMSAARNSGLRIANGEYIQFLDADDLLVPTKLAVHVAYMEMHPHVDVVYGDVRYFLHGKPKQLSRSFDMQDTSWSVPLEGAGLSIVEELVKQNHIVINAALLRSSLLQKVGTFAESLRSLEDWEFWLRCAMQGAWFHYEATPNTWAMVRVHPSSTSQNSRRMLHYNLKVRRQLRKDLQKVGAESALALNNAAIHSTMETQAHNQFMQGHRLDGLRTYWQLAQATGQFFYCLRTALYWVRQRPE